MKSFKKRILVGVMASTLCFQNAIGANIGSSVLDGVLGQLDSNFANIFQKGLRFTKRCFGTSFTFPNTDDPCALASELDSLRLNVCSAFGGNVNVGVNGFRSMCNAMKKDFTNYVSQQAVSFAEYAMLQNKDTTDNFKAKLGNGMELTQYLKVWDIKNILKDKSATNITANALRDGNMTNVALYMNYAKTAGAKTDPNKIKIEDIKAPADLNAYHKGIDESVKSYRKTFENASPNAHAIEVKAKLQQNSNYDPNEYLEKIKTHYDGAKIAEIGMTFSNSDYKKIAIPTQEYVDLLRNDLKPSAIIQIQKQQAYEVATITNIERKWTRKYDIATLLIEKEQILAQKFDSVSARAEVNKVAVSGF